jgi:hypothetical protein
MQDEPTPLEMLAVIAEFLRGEVIPKLNGATAFQARVAANALDLVGREIEMGQRLRAAEHTRLQALLGDGSIEQLTRELARRIAARDLRADAPGLIEHLWDTTLAKLAVDQPAYAGYKRALQLRAAATVGSVPTNTETKI